MLLSLILSAALISTNEAPAVVTNSSPAESIGYDEAIEPYVSFLEKQKQTPEEYILGLFNQNDIVILCERFHPEVTQYDMIYQLVSDPRFQRQGGHIFTEVGTAALRPYIESFLMDDRLSDEQVNEKLRYIARNIGWVGAWGKTNFYDFLRKIHYLNRSLPKDRRVHIYPSDLDFRWEDATKDSWAEFNKTQMSKRDKIMADNIISKFNEIRHAGSRDKALVIMNYRHACPHFKPEDGRKSENTGGFLMDAYPGKVANVMINTLATLQSTNDKHAVLTAFQQGKWDAAFAVLGNPNVGFDFKGSPLGEDAFDFWPFLNHRRYQDVFTGFVFFKPLAAHRMSSGLPAGLLDQPFTDELLKRNHIMGASETREQIEKEYGLVHSFGYDECGESDHSEKIKQWLKAKPSYDGTVDAQQAPTLAIQPYLPKVDPQLQKELVDYLKSHYATPEDYVISKFADHDVVILGESHCIKHNPELVQALIPRLYKRGIYTLAMEFIRREDQPLIDRLVNSPDYDEMLARRILFNECVFWGYQEYVDIFKSAWRLNRALPEGTRPFRILGVNTSQDWSLIKNDQDAEDPDIRRRVFNGGEDTWAKVILDEVVAKKEKAMVYCGMHHAFTTYRQPAYDERKHEFFLSPTPTRMGQYLYQAMGERVMAIYLHAPWISAEGYKSATMVPAAGGIIDAVMAAVDPHFGPAGFNTRGTPFGRLPGAGSLYEQGYKDFTLATFCDGYIFQRPLAEYENVTPIRDFVNETNIEQARAQSPNPHFRKASIEEFNRTIASDLTWKNDIAALHYPTNMTSGAATPAVLSIKQRQPDVSPSESPMQAIGLAKGDLTDTQIAVKAVREFFEALIAKDYAKAGQLFGGVTAAKMEQDLGKVNWLRIVSIGEPKAEPGGGGMVVSCSIEGELGGHKSSKDFRPKVRPVGSSQPDRWIVCGPFDRDK